MKPNMHPKLTFIASAVCGALLLPTLAHSEEVVATEGYATETLFTGSKLNAGFYWVSRQRDRRTSADGPYAENLNHDTLNVELAYESGLLANMFGFDIAAFGAYDVRNTTQGHEFNFRPADKISDERWDGLEEDGASLHRAQFRVQLGEGDYLAKLRAGYIQASAGILGVNWSFLPGTYLGTQLDVNWGNWYGDYAWVNEYKAPWYQKTDHFYDAKGNKIDYLHSAGLGYRFANGLFIEGGVGWAPDYMTNYRLKAGMPFELGGGTLTTSAQWYGADDSNDANGDANNRYNELAWLTALTADYRLQDWRVFGEFTAVNAPGQQGYFLQRVTPGYGNSQGRLDIWWDLRSDWNHDNEKALYGGVQYFFDSIGVPGLSVATYGAYGWDLNGWGGQSNAPVVTGGKEAALALDFRYTLGSFAGALQNTSFRLQMMKYDNKTDQPSWGAYPNLFQDEKDVKLFVIVPWNII